MRTRAHRFAFTFLEIMLVVLIIGILVSVVVPKFAKRGEQARRSAAMMSIRGIETALLEFEMNYGRFPDDLEELVDPPDPPAGGEPLEYLDRIPRDPWGHRFIYNFPAEHSGDDFDLYSSGNNGMDDQGEEDDIAPWAVDEESDL